MYPTALPNYVISLLILRELINYNNISFMNIYSITNRGSKVLVFIWLFDKIMII